MKLVFATHNTHKIDEVRKLLPPHIQVLSLFDIGCDEEIPETGVTLEENAKIKSDYVIKTYGYNCFADDSGLEIDVLNGEPGVYSARYAGDQKDNEANINKVWNKLEGETNSKAQFRTVISAHINGREWKTEGVVRGEIVFEKRGLKGFGYDPIFIPEGYVSTFAELGEDIKNKISHRAIATEKFLKILSSLKI